MREVHVQAFCQIEGLELIATGNVEDFELFQSGQVKGDEVVETQVEVAYLRVFRETDAFHIVAYCVEIADCGVFAEVEFPEQALAVHPVRPAGKGIKVPETSEPVDAGNAVGIDRHFFYGVRLLGAQGAVVVGVVFAQEERLEIQGVGRESEIVLERDERMPVRFDVEAIAVVDERLQFVAGVGTEADYRGPERVVFADGVAAQVKVAAFQVDVEPAPVHKVSVGNRGHQQCAVRAHRFDKRFGDDGDFVVRNGKLVPAGRCQQDGEQKYGHQGFHSDRKDSEKSCSVIVHPGHTAAQEQMNRKRT